MSLGFKEISNSTHKMSFFITNKHIDEIQHKISPIIPLMHALNITLQMGFDMLKCRYMYFAAHECKITPINDKMVMYAKILDGRNP